MPAMRLKHAFRFLLALALLAVWQAALLHPLQHVDARGAFVHVPGKHVPKVPGDGSSPNSLCDALAAVAACVSGAAQLAAVAAPLIESVPSRQALRRPGATLSAYRSQAPPALL